jgi:hypothetical protein
MSLKARRYLSSLYKQRGTQKPAMLSLDEAAEAMEGYWLHNREKELLPLIKKENRRIEALRDVIKEIKGSTKKKKP